jgi:hypothetical protein
MISEMSSSKSGIGWIGSLLVLTFLRGRGEPHHLKHSKHPKHPDQPPESHCPGMELVDTSKRDSKLDTALTL